jgi:hypothetical protein
LPDKKKAGATSFTGNPAVSPYSGNPAIRLLRTRGFPSPDCSGFGFNYSMSRLLIAIAVPETIILYFYIEYKGLHFSARTVLSRN